MDQPGILQHGQTLQELLCEDFDQLRTETLELILLDELVQIGRKAFKDQTQMILVRKRLDHPDDVMRVVWIVLAVELSMSVTNPVPKLDPRTSSRIATSIFDWFRYAGLFFTTLTAMISCVLMF